MYELCTLTNVFFWLFAGRDLNIVTNTRFGIGVIIWL